MAGSNLEMKVKSPFREDHMSEKVLRLHICCVKIRHAEATARSLVFRRKIDLLKAIVALIAKKELE